jgi:hypothetical protein
MQVDQTWHDPEIFDVDDPGRYQPTPDLDHASIRDPNIGNLIDRSLRCWVEHPATA